MVGRKLSTAALLGSIAIVAIVGGCRDQALTAPGSIGDGALASNLKLLTGDGQVGAVASPLPTNLTVKVVDAGGTAVVGAPVRWSVLSGGGSVTPPTGSSDANGLVSTSWTMGATLGANKVRAYLTNGYVVDSVDFLATATSGAPVVITLSEASAPAATARVATKLSPMDYKVVDQFGFPVEGATVTFGTGFGSGSVTPTSALTDATGKATTVWTLGTATGTQSVSATLAGQLPLTTTVTATADTSRRIAILTGDNQTSAVGGTLAAALSVQVTDRFNNPVPGETVTFTDSVGNGAVLTPGTTATDNTGIAAATMKLGVLAGTQRIRVKTPGSGGQVVRFTSTATVTFRDIFAGNYFACAVSTNDRAYCWGFGEDGQLGNTSLITRNAPNWPVTTTDTILGPYTTFRALSGGKSHVCGVAISQRVFCWGVNADGRQFMLPPSLPTSKATDVTSPSFPANSQLASTRSVDAGESFSCALTLGGIALCSGNNESGQVGFGTTSLLLGTSMVDTSTNVLPGHPQRYSSVVTGERHACGMPRSPVAQIPWCWGSNATGQLGNGTVVDSAKPQLVQTVAGVTGYDSASVVAGALHSCALVSTGTVAVGTAYCWGSNAFGQLGQGGALGDPVAHMAPLAVAGGQVFVRLYAGLYHTCGLTAAGTAFCWGRNTSGQLGDGTQGSATSPVAVTGGLTFRSLALGELFTCGITSPTGPGATGTNGVAGTLYCWGDNEFGQLGIGAFSANAAPILTPTRVAFQQ